MYMFHPPMETCPASGHMMMLAFLAAEAPLDTGGNNPPEKSLSTAYPSNKPAPKPDSCSLRNQLDLAAVAALDWTR